MVMFEDKREVASTDITITELNGTRLGSHGYHVHHTRGQVLSGLKVDGGLLDGVAGDAVRIEGDGHMKTKSSHIRIKARDVRGALVEDRLGSSGLQIDVTQVG